MQSIPKDSKNRIIGIPTWIKLIANAKGSKKTKKFSETIKQKTK